MDGSEETNMPLLVAHRKMATSRANAGELRTRLEQEFELSAPTLGIIKTVETLDELGHAASAIAQTMYREAKVAPAPQRGILPWKKSYDVAQAREAKVLHTGALIRTGLHVDDQMGIITITLTENQHVNTALQALKSALEKATALTPSGPEKAIICTELRDALVALGEAKKGDPFHSGGTSKAVASRA
ncbi:MAG: hypothetical protein U1E36_09150 [Rickettsiales bacterium]